MQHNIALDIGTSGIRMAVRGRGLVYRQSAAIARRDGNLIEAGNEALRLLSRVPDDITVSFPVSGAAIQDETALLMWLKYLLRHAQTGGLRSRGRVIISVPPDMQNAPLRQLMGLVMEAGASACSSIRSDFAAAIGAPVDIQTRRGVLLCTLGAGSMCVTAFCNNRAVAMRALPFGMAQIDQAIVRKLRRDRGLLIGIKAAEELKTALSAIDAKSTIAAIDAQTGFPKHFEIAQSDIQSASDQVLDAFFELIHQVLNDLPEEFAADLADAGLILSGGGAQLFGLAQRIAERFSLPCHLVDDPSASAARGLQTILEAKDKYDALLTSHLSVLAR